MTIKKVIAALSMDLSKAFDCLQHDHNNIAKLYAYGFEMQALKLIYSYLSNRFQSIRVKDTYSSVNKVKSGVLQGSLLGAILFNIQFNDIFDIINEAELYNYADDNNLSAVGDSTVEAKNILKQQTTVILEWFDQNHLIANPDKFYLIFLSTDKTDQLVDEQVNPVSLFWEWTLIIYLHLINILLISAKSSVPTQCIKTTFKIYGPH